jgi:uncharacterized protein
MRACGDCSLCCKLLEIDAAVAPEVGDKPAGVLCRHCTSPGCKIYERRPKLCADFRCQWLADEKLGDHWFPPTAGMLLAFSEAEATMYVVEDRPGAHRKQPYAFDIARMTRWGQTGPTKFEVRITSPEGVES